MKRILKIIQLLSLAVLIAGCTKSGASAPKKEGQLVKVRLATLGISEGSIPLYLGIKKGFFSEQGIEVEIRNFSGGSNAATAGASGDVDAGVAGSPILIGAAAGIPYKIIGSPVASRNPFVLVARPNYTTVAELKGKKVSVGKAGNGTRQAFTAIARAHGFKLDDFEQIDAGESGTAFPSLQTGKVEAITTSGMTAAKAEVAGIGKILARAEDVFGKYQHSFFFATDKFIAEKPEVVRGFLAGYRKAAEYAKAHPDEAIRFGIEELKLEEKPLRLVIAKQLPKWEVSGKIDIEGTDNAIKVLKDLGEIDPKNTITARQIIDEQFLSK